MSKESENRRLLVFMLSTVMHSVMATCDRLHVGASFFKDKRLRGFGYNGSPTGMDHCDDVGHILVDNHCVATNHAEANAVTNTPREYHRGADVIITYTPCIDCLKDLIEAGVARIHYLADYKNAKGGSLLEEMAKKAGIEIIRHNLDWENAFQEMFDLMSKKGGVLNKAGYKLKVTKILEDTPEA
jgi:dCMP deaminase